MTTDRGRITGHPAGEQPLVECGKPGAVVADTFAGRVHMEWEAGERAAVTPLGQLPFFIEYLKQGGLFDGWVAGCPLYLTSPNAPSKRDILGTVMLSVLAGHRRYAHITTLRCDPVNPPLLGMAKVVSEDAVRRALSKIEEEAGRAWLQEQLDYCTRPLLGEPWILDVDTTVKPLYGHQEGAVLGYNPKKPGRPPAFAGEARIPITATCWPIYDWCWRSRFKRATSTRRSIRRQDCGHYWTGSGRSATRPRGSTFASAHADGRGAPTAAIRSTAIEPAGSTPERPLDAYRNQLTRRCAQPFG